MGIYGAMGTAVAGLRSQSFALESISGNIANVQTTGYKRVETSFSDLVPGSNINTVGPSSVQATGRQTLNVQGDISQADVGTFMGISGDGFFSVRDRADTVDGQPVFGDQQLYSRRGDFEFDRQGYMVNGGGYYLMGLEVDPQSGNVSGTNLEPIRVTNDFIPARATNQVTLHANLPTTPRTPDYNADVPGSELFDPAALDGSGNPMVSGSGGIAASNSETFIGQSVSGGAITVRDTNGQPVNLQLRWAKTANADAGPPAVQDTWNLFYLTNSQATGADDMWQKAPYDYEFDAAGNLDDTMTQVNVPNLTIDGVEVGDVVLKHGKGGVTQFNDPNGVVRTTELTQNGYAAGELTDVTISDAGRLVGSYSNGQTYDLYEIPLATFNAPNRLQAMDGGAYAETPESGEALMGAGGSIMGAALEASNTDIADEFTKLIVTQQAYSAGTRIVTTSDEMMQEALNMKR